MGLLEEAADAALQRIFGDILQAAHQLQELLARQALEERGGLGHVPDALLGLDRFGGHHVSGDAYRPVPRRQDARQDLDGGALARAVRSEQPDDLPAPQRERDAVQDLAGAVAEGQAVDVHGRIVAVRQVRRILAGHAAL